ncbi:MAG: glycosyltransferase family 87 protein [Jatrophihabitantaceae bacterium]
MTFAAPPRPPAADIAPRAADLLPPSHTDPTAGRASRIIGGVWGRHAGVAPGSWWTPVRMVMAMTCFTLLLGFAQKSPCATGQWTGNKQYTHMCYSDVVPLWGDERLDVGAVPYRDTSVEYPVLTGGFMWLTAEFTRALHKHHPTWTDFVIFGVPTVLLFSAVHALAANSPEVVIFGAVTALLLSACGLMVTAGTAQAARRRPYDAAIFALSPLLIIHAFSNWDLLAMALTSAALWAWARRHPVLAGTLIGLGAAAKLYPAFLLVAIAILAIRTRKYAPAGWAVLSAALVWLAVNVPIALAYYRGWSEFYRFSIDRPTERSTLWAMGRTLSSVGVGASDAPFWKPPGAAVAAVLLAALVIVAWIGLRAPVKPRLAQLVFLVVLAFLLTTKVWSPQYSLWLVPLLALARPRWRLNMVWQFTEIAVWFLTLTLLLGLNPGQPQHGIGYGWLMVVLVARDVLLLSIAGLIMREMWRPELDVVRTGGVDDPGGGYFDGAPAWDVIAQAETSDARRNAMSAP